MSENWPFFLILAYFVTLIASLIKRGTRLRDELKYAGWYFVVGLMAASWAHERYVTAHLDLKDPIEIEVFGMIRKQWYQLVIPYACAYVALNSSRLLILLFVEYKNKQARRKSELRSDTT